jgi:hypothetical protein
LQDEQRNGIVHAMKTTIDAAGRLVIPKRNCDEKQGSSRVLSWRSAGGKD